MVPGAVLTDDGLRRGLGSQARGTRRVHALCQQPSTWTGAEGTQRARPVTPRSELLLPNPLLAHSPKIDYFATNYLQM